MFQRLFPTLAKVEPVKLMMLPVIALLALGIGAAILDGLFGSRLMVD